VPPGVILDSLARCLDAGLQPGQAMAVPVVEAADLARRRDRAAFVRRLAQAELETLSRQIAGSNFLLAFADSEGVILDLYADNRFSMSSSDAGILPGSCWRESLAGTNGLGTALATGSALAVTGLEHYFLKLGDISCTAAPVRDAQGQVVGVLDASSFYESRQRHTQALVQMAATHIENGLLSHQMRGQLVLAVHPRAEYLGTLSAALLAFDENDCLVSINTPGRSLFNGLGASRGKRFEELFLEPLQAVLARLHQGFDVRLRDALGSAVVARMVGRPRDAMPQVLGGWPAHAKAGAPSAGTELNLALPHAHPAPQAEPTAARGRAHRAAAATPAATQPGFLTDDPAVAAACRLVEAAVRLRAPILLHGETGTGKEMLARHAHNASGRRGAFVAVNCAALPADLFEAELFGYVSGAFTGSRREGSAGLIVAADGGTLLLDEVRELPLQLQAALLRFLDDQTVRPVGGHATRQVNVQLLAATHADLEDEVRAKTFRADLMYRLNTVRVSLPPLRSRQDFAQAAQCTLQAVDASAALTSDAIDQLAKHSWPGNFRELRSVLTRALLARGAGQQGQPLQAQDIALVLPTGLMPSEPPATTHAQPLMAMGSMLQRSAAELVRAEYERTGRSVSKTSRNLAISRTTVYRHLRGSTGT
jgi:transcriptional regulator of acetoin/glycerol metabolism